jgi:hypothetical protein
MKEILAEAAAVGQATVRALAYRCRLKDAFFYPDSAWNTPFVGGSSEFLHQGARLLDARSYFFFYATGITPAMAIQRVGAGSAYARGVRGREESADGSKTYKLHLPPSIPAKQFWSLVLYDTNALDAADAPAVSEHQQPEKRRGDQPRHVCRYLLRADAAVGQGKQLVQTWPGKGWTVILRLYGPLQPFFDKTGDRARSRRSRNGTLLSSFVRTRGATRLLDTRDA